MIPIDVTALASGPSQGVRAAPSYALESTLTGMMPSAPGALLLVALSVGSGGYVTPALAQTQTKSSSPGMEWPTGAPAMEAREVATPPSEQVVLIRRWLSLNVADAARVLQVQRPTIYAWTSGTGFPSLERRQRISTVFKLANLWHEVSADPVGARLRQPVVQERSLFDLLSDVAIDRAAVTRAIRLLAEPGQADQHRSAANVAKAHGFPARPERQQRRAIEHETRFRRPVR
jgi:hypothetical protein